MLIYHNAIYVQAADPRRDEENRRLAGEAYKLLKQKIERGEVTLREGGGFEIELSPSLGVSILPRLEGTRTRGKFRHVFHVNLIDLFVAGPFWDHPLEKQLELLPHLVINPITFAHEYIHYLDHVRGVKLRSQRKPHIKDEDFEEMTPEEYIEYLSDPSEFNAWYQSMVHVIQDDMEHTVDLFGKFELSDKGIELPLFMRDPNTFVEHFMWKFEMLGWPVSELPPKLYRKIQKRLAQTFHHLLGGGKEEKEPRDLSEAIGHSRDAAWDLMEEHVIGWYGYKDPEGVAKRFKKAFGDSVNDFLQTMTKYFLDHLLLDVDSFTPSEQLKFKSAMRTLYKELRKERDFLIENARG